MPNATGTGEGTPEHERLAPARRALRWPACVRGSGMLRSRSVRRAISLVISWVCVVVLRVRGAPRAAAVLAGARSAAAARCSASGCGEGSTPSGPRTGVGRSPPRRRGAGDVRARAGTGGRGLGVARWRMPGSRRCSPPSGRDPRCSCRTTRPTWPSWRRCSPRSRTRTSRPGSSTRAERSPSRSRLRDERRVRRLARRAEARQAADHPAAGRARAGERHREDSRAGPERPHGPDPRRPAGRGHQPARGCSGCSSASTRPDACLVPSFGTELRAVATVLSAFWAGPGEPLFETVCLVYPRPR